MKRLFIGLFLAGCGTGAPGSVEIGPAPEEELLPSPPSAPIQSATAPPEAPPEEDPPLLESPPDPAPAAPPTDLAPAGFHEAAGGACYLPDVLPVGACKCAVYDPVTKKLITPGDMCFDSCSYNAEGIGVMHAFCVDGGLATEMRPK
jgi:hypothetical protein